MKLEQSQVEIVSTEADSTLEFSVANASFIMDLVTRYNDPIKSIVREITANAIDANREAKRSHIPIKIVLPSSLTSHLSIEDSGPGISPDRLGDVYSKIGASTKRHTNKQQGGFGIGAKSPFSYTDQFFVETTVDGMTWSYKMYRNNGFHIDKISETKTGKPNGTKVTIPVQSKDYRKFIDAIYYYGRLWETPPDIIGGTKIQPIKPDLVGNGWIYCPSIRDSNLLIDNIPYWANSVNVRSGLIFTFNTGEIELVPTRENVIEDDKFRKLVLQRTEEAQKKFVEKIIIEAESKPSLIEALTFVGNTFAPHYKEPHTITITFQGKKYTCQGGIGLPPEIKDNLLYPSSTTINSLKCVVEIPKTVPFEINGINRCVKLNSYRKGILNQWLSKHNIVNYCFVYEGELPELQRSAKLFDLKRDKSLAKPKSPRKHIVLKNEDGRNRRFLIDSGYDMYYAKADSTLKGVYKLLDDSHEAFIAQNPAWKNIQKEADSLLTKLKGKKVYRDYQYVEVYKPFVNHDSVFKGDFSVKEHQELFSDTVFQVLLDNKLIHLESYTDKIHKKYPLFRFISPDKHNLSAIIDYVQLKGAQNV